MPTPYTLYLESQLKRGRTQPEVEEEIKKAIPQIFKWARAKNIPEPKITRALNVIALPENIWKREAPPKAYAPGAPGPIEVLSAGVKGAAREAVRAGEIPPALVEVAKPFAEPLNLAQEESENVKASLQEWARRIAPVEEMAGLGKEPEEEIPLHKILARTAVETALEMTPITLSEIAAAIPTIKGIGVGAKALTKAYPWLATELKLPESIVKRIQSEIAAIKYRVGKGLGVSQETGLVPFDVRKALAENRITIAKAAQHSEDVFKEELMKRMVKPGEYAAPGVKRPMPRVARPPAPSPPAPPIPEPMLAPEPTLPPEVPPTEIPAPPAPPPVELPVPVPLARAKFAPIPTKAKVEPIEKVVKAVLPRRTHMPALAEFGVNQEGALEVTDLDMGLVKKTTIPPGVYRFVGPNIEAGTAPWAERPVIPRPPAETAAKVGRDELIEKIRRVIPFSSADHPALQTIAIIAKDGKSQMVATDGKRLIRQTIAIPDLPDGTYLLPNKPGLIGAFSAFEGSKFDISLAYEEKKPNAIFFGQPDGFVTTRLNPRTYPDLADVLGGVKKVATQLVVSRTDMLSALKQLRPYFEKGEEAVTFTREGEGLVLRVAGVSGPAMQKAVSVPAKWSKVKYPSGEKIPNLAITMPIKGIAGKQDIAFNPLFLEDALATLDGETAYIGIAKADAPAVITSVNPVIIQEKPPTYKIKGGAGYFVPPGPGMTRPDQRPDMEMPELVRLTKELLGKPPLVRRLRKYAGLFRGPEGRPGGEIKLAPGTVSSSDPTFTAHVLSHEIGHLVDWLPDYTLARGNVYGRLMTLRKFMGGVEGEAKELRAELWELSKWWDPFDESAASERFLEYRKKARELYADALSVLLNKPEELKSRAPKFYAAFWQNIDKKPDVRDALFRLEEFMSVGEGERLHRRQVEVHEMFQNAERIWREKRDLRDKIEKSAFFKTRDFFFNKNAKLTEMVESARKRGVTVPADADPLTALDDVAYVGGIRKAHADRVDFHLRHPLKARGMDDEVIGEYMMWKMIANAKLAQPIKDQLTGEMGTQWVQKRIARPLGHTPETAAKQLQFLLDSLGPEKARELESRMNWYYDERQKLLQEAYDNDLLTPEMLDMAKQNPHYATTMVSDYLKDYVSSRMMRQIGTYKEAANFFTATVMKDFAIIGAIARQKANVRVRDFLLKTAPEEIAKAKVKMLGKHRRELETPPEGLETLKLFEKGKLAGYHVDPYIANTADSLPSGMVLGALEWMRWANSTLLKPMYTGFNVGFQTTNLVRDFMRSWKFNPDASLLNMLKAYGKALPHSQRRAWGTFDALVNEMESQAVLGPSYTQMIKAGGELADETQLEYLMERYQTDKKAWKNPISELLQFIGDMGDTIEAMPKVARYMAWKESLGTTKPSPADLRIVAREVRGYSGSPPFLLGGRGKSIYNTVFLYSNAGWQGLRWDYIGAVKDPRTRAGYWWKTALTVGVPTMLAYMAQEGLLGEDAKEQFERMSPYDKANYIVYPIGETESGRPLYFRFPLDYTGQIIHALAWQLLHIEAQDPLRSTQQALYPVGQAITPEPTPAIETMTNLYRFATGKDMYGSFRGAVLSEEEKRAGGWYAFKGLMRYIAGQASFIPTSVKYGKGEPPLSSAEKIVKFSPILSRYLRVGRTIPESELKTRRERSREEARRQLEKAR